MLNLIYDMRKHGGVAFLVVLTLVYVTVGYPMYVFETMMGQYWLVNYFKYYFTS